MQTAAEAEATQEAEDYIDALEAEIDRLRADNEHLRLERELFESFGYSRGQRRPYRRRYPHGIGDHGLARS